MMVKNPYRFLGIVLTAAGAVLAPLFYFVIGSPALAAAAISAIILGFTCVAIANARPYLSPEAAQMLLKTGVENTAALLEELGLSEKAIYLPSSASGGRARALIPLAGNPGAEQLLKKLPGRLIVRYGPGAEDMAIAVATPGSVNLGLLENKPDTTAGEIEAALNYLLNGVLDIAGGVSVNLTDSRVEVKISQPGMPYEDAWYYRSLGSPLASIAAAVVSEALDRPVRISEEKAGKRESEIVLELM